MNNPNLTLNITENPRIATRIEIRQGYPCLILEVWNDSGRDYLCRHRCYPVDSTRFEQLEALRELVVDTLHIDAKFDDRLNDYFVATLMGRKGFCQNLPSGCWKMTTAPTS